jgi:hypothetical protein
MRKTVFVAAALFAASSVFAEAPTPKGNTASSESPRQVKQIAGGQAGGASPVVAGGAAQARLSPVAWVAIGVAAVVVVASMSSDAPGGPSAPATH